MASCANALPAARAPAKAASLLLSRRRAPACCRPPCSPGGRAMKRAPDIARGVTRAITSLQNDRVKLIRSLEMRKARRDTGLFVAEGASVLLTARDARWKP